jgi:hypothetical protein
MDDIDLSNLPGSKRSTMQHGFSGHPSATDRKNSSSIAKGDMRAGDNESRLSKSKNGVDEDQVSISQPKNVMEV